MDVKHTLGDLTTPYIQRKVYTLTYSSGNHAVLHHEELQQISGTLCRGRDETSSFGDVRCVIYIYFEDVGYGVAAGSVQDPAHVDAQTYLAGIAPERFASPEAYIAWLDGTVEIKGFINNAYIALARKIAPNKVPTYEQARLDYYTETQRRDEERRKAREEQDAAFCQEENAKADAQVDKAIAVIRSGGLLENVFITYYRSRYNVMSYSVINHIARKYGVNIPISVQGWIDRALRSVIIRDGAAVSYFHRSKSKSGTFGRYMNNVIAAVQAAEVAETAA